MTFNLHKKIVIVTGASSGIGKALVIELLHRGAIVIGIGRSRENLAKIANNASSKFIPFVCDVSCKRSVQKVLSGLAKKNLFPEVFFLNAGIAGEQALEASGFDLQKHHDIMNVNYFGVLNFVNHWKKNGCKPAHFIVTSSVNALWASPNGSAYAASKAAISKAFEGLAASFYNSGTKFSSIYCGPVKTKGLKGSFPFTWSPQKMAKYMADFAEGKQRRQYPSIFYYFVCQILKSLPHRWIAKWFRSNDGINSKK